ncbi:Molybdenum cofactor guanylyltransferase [Paenibacillus solanacearum]|uniref:Probable molybdenum cofactor guanylyltransferase n=1 Tax=Paenibacillus solanacearum TaxID=2048548 RepID=A0A916K5D3_9BACL|nr:molybdenum cofactor guanylyltransferase [Paenibacillus solanacearum]CAG7642121.1 Molybdenum cofactor guanylyltransferase [Paenibacillus solanacearum]
MLTGVILAGGQNSRMNGENKAFLMLDHMTFIDRQIREMKKHCSEVIIVSSDPAPYLRTLERGIRILTDYYPGKGPLGGMYSGLTLASSDRVWVAGCDMPYISDAAAQLMLARLDEGIDAVLPWIDHQLYPLHGVYHRRCAQPIRALLEQGEVTFPPLLKQLIWCEMPEGEFLKNQIDPRFVIAIKTPEDYEQAVSYSESLQMNYRLGL